MNNGNKKKLENKGEKQSMSQVFSETRHSYHDLCLTCITCNKNFDYPATEQDFFAKNNLEAPKRCRDCRAKKNKQSDSTPIPVQSEGLNHKSNKTQLDLMVSPQTHFIESILANSLNFLNQIEIITNEFKFLKKEITELKVENQKIHESLKKIQKQLKV